MKDVKKEYHKDKVVKRVRKICKCCEGGAHYYYTIQMSEFYDNIFSEDQVILMLGTIRDFKVKDRAMLRRDYMRRARFNDRKRIDSKEGQVFPMRGNVPKFNIIDD